MYVLVSQSFVLLIGVTVMMITGWGVFAPEKLLMFVTSVMDKFWGVYVAVIVRLVLGTALIIAAPASRFPIIFQAMGAIAVAAAIVLAVMGRARIRRFITWWSKRFSVPLVRLWLLFGLAFGGFLVYGVL
jgi:hypothetical protein